MASQSFGIVGLGVMGERRSLMMVPAGKAVLQAQRDYFGVHTYQRVDKESRFHTQWTGHKGESVTKA